MKYLMDHEKEAERLDRQSKDSFFDVSSELEGIEIPEGANILEVGCGAGTLIGYIAKNYRVRANACDLQRHHVEYAQKKLGEAVSVFQHDITEMDLPEKYDFIFLRYVAHHIGAERLNASMARFKKALNPGGKLVIIDVDSLLSGVGSINPELLQFIKKIDDGFSGDIRIGRKVPAIMRENGFEEIDYSGSMCLFKGESRETEVSQWGERLENGREMYSQILGSKEAFDRFKDLYINELSDERIPVFFNKFISIGVLR